MKTCPRCKQKKELSEFNGTERRPSSYCKICTREYSKERYQNDPKVRQTAKEANQARRNRVKYRKEHGLD